MLRIVSDIHGDLKRYTSLANGADYSLQIGDLGFTYEYKKLLLKGLDVQRNKFFCGNHDDYDFLKRDIDDETRERFKTFNIGDFGLRRHGNAEFYFLRGAFTVDHKWRTVGLNMFENEELPGTLHPIIIEDFAKKKPDVMITHDCPQLIGYDGVLKTPDVLERLGYCFGTFTTKTGVLLQQMFEAHQPKLWVFGHFHLDWSATINGTDFRCLPIGGYLDI